MTKAKTLMFASLLFVSVEFVYADEITGSSSIVATAGNRGGDTRIKAGVNSNKVNSPNSAGQTGTGKDGTADTGNSSGYGTHSPGTTGTGNPTGSGTSNSIGNSSGNGAAGGTSGVGSK